MIYFSEHFSVFKWHVTISFILACLAISSPTQCIPFSLFPLLPFSPSYPLCAVSVQLKSLPFLFTSLLFFMSGYSDLNTCLRIQTQHPYMKENTWMLSSWISVISLRMILLQLRGIGRDLVVIQTMWLIDDKQDLTKLESFCWGKDAVIQIRIQYTEGENICWLYIWQRLGLGIYKQQNPKH